MIKMILAIDNTWGLGKDNQLLCRIPDDLKRFKSLTSGHPMIMGRKTFESLPGVLPNRKHFVISKTMGAHSNDDVIVANSLEKAISEAKKLDDELFIIGGGSIYKQAANIVEVVYLTEILTSFPADTYFYSLHALLERFRIIEESSEKIWNDIPYKFVTYKKISASN